MTLSKTIGVEANLEVRVKAGVDPPVLLKIASTVANRITKGTAQLLAKDAKSVAKITILKEFAKVVQIAGNIIVDKTQNKGKGKKFHEVNEQSEEVMDDLAEQVQSLFYNDVHFNVINTRMHTLIKCETPDGQPSDHTLKVDTGADGNLMPMSMFSRFFPQVSLGALNRTIEKGVTLYAYNNTPIKQYGTCHVKLSFKNRSSIYKFFTVEHETAIVGISDSEKLRLVRVNLDMVRDVKIINEVKEGQAFKEKIEKKYPELFKGIGLMDSKISIKLKDGAVPHVKPVRRVPHAMQKPLKSELDKMVKEEILHKVNIRINRVVEQFCLCEKCQWENQIVSGSNTFEQMDHEA